MESSIAEFLLRKIACERLPTVKCLETELFLVIQKFLVLTYAGCAARVKQDEAARGLVLNLQR